MRRFLGIALLAAAFAQFGYRGMQRVRNEVPMWDFASVYAAARTWTHGENPYDRLQVLKTWRETGSFADRDASYFATVYPPSSLLMLVPFAPLSVEAAMAAWLLITLSLLVAQFLALVQLAQLPWKDSRALILLGASLLSAPFQFGILSGQLSMPAISLCIVCFWSVSREKDKTAGFLLGLACALKPQVGAPFLVYYLVLRQWRVAVLALLTGGVIAVVSIVAMHVSHINWISGWTGSVAATQQIGAVNDYGWANGFRDEIVDLKIVLVSFIASPRLLRVTVEMIALALCGWYVWVFPRDRLRERRPSGRQELLLLATIWAISLLPIYHRIYDVALLTTALAWALAELDSSISARAWMLLLPMVLFLIPFDLVEAVGKRKASVLTLAKSGFWQSVIAPHYAWGLVAVTVTLLAILSWPLVRSQGTGLQMVSKP